MTQACPNCGRIYENNHHPRTLETTLNISDIRNLKKDKKLTKKVFVTTLILKYNPRTYRQQQTHTQEQEMID